MAASSAGNALTSVRLFLATLTPSDVPDRELLDRFVRNRDHAAFASLVHRHGATHRRLPSWRRCVNPDAPVAKKY